MQDNSKGLWGRGWAFPPSFLVAKEGQPAGPLLVEDQEDIRQSLRILFSTLPGERIMRADYGCDLNAVLFDSISADLLADIRRLIRDSVLRYEPRIILQEVTAQQNISNPTQLQVGVSYRIRGSDLAGELTGMIDINGATEGRWQ
jgi:uncharacterized protein